MPHVFECYESYSRAWDTREEMTNADIQAKQDFHDSKPEVWKKFELEGTAAAKPAPTPIEPKKPAAPVLTAHTTEPAIEKPAPKEEKASTRLLDPEVQKPSAPPAKKPLSKPPPGPAGSPPRMVRVNVPPAEQHKKTVEAGEPIRGPKVPPRGNDPEPSGGSGGKHGAGIYPDMYGPEVLQAPGHKDGSFDLSQYDFVPAAEFPAGPLYPSPYLNDFSKILKT